MKASGAEDLTKNFIIGGGTLPGSDTADANRRRWVLAMQGSSSISGTGLSDERQIQLARTAMLA